MRAFRRRSWALRRWATVFMSAWASATTAGSAGPSTSPPEQIPQQLTRPAAADSRPSQSSQPPVLTSGEDHRKIDVVMALAVTPLVGAPRPPLPGPVVAVRRVAVGPGLGRRAFHARQKRQLKQWRNSQCLHAGVTQVVA